MTTVTAHSRHFTASAVVIDPEYRKVLLVGHLASGQRQFPGGHVDPDETGDEAAIREVFEETGVCARIWQPIRYDIPGATTHPTPWMVAEFPAPAKPHKGEPAHHHIDYLYIALADSTAPVTAQVAEVSGVEWVSIGGLTAVSVRAEVPSVAAAAWAVLAGERVNVRGEVV